MKKKNDGKEYMIFRNMVVDRSEVPNLIRKAKEVAGTGWSSEAPVGGNPGTDKDAGSQVSGKK